MKMMTELAALDIFLHDQRFAFITHLPGDKNLFSFTREYVENMQRPTLSLSFKDVGGELITDFRPTRTRLSPFFSNLLPEGHMREYLASQANTNPQREFYLLKALGRDLPGALKILPAEKIDRWLTANEGGMTGDYGHIHEETVLRFSLAGVQLKFSAIWESEGGLTIPTTGVGGSWIIKLPSAIYPGVPQNEYAMMELARCIGIDVPETALVPIEQIHNIPKGVGAIANDAFIIKRFDRTPEGQGIHIEDFAQVFAVYPEKKYQAANYRNIAEVIWSETGEKGIVEFIRRFVFNALIGNGDMHLKNWSLIYHDKIKPALAPAYDFVSTIPYIPNDQLALNFVDSKAFGSLTYAQFNRFAAKANLPQELVHDTVRETVQAFRIQWRTIGDLPLDKDIVKIINKHLKTIPIYTD